jgi:NAD(P)-dependent dehydrogenase (short-subunit alcohol dehydrogenase family)
MADQTVVITGASGGVGRALARLYGGRGANVALLARGEAGLQAAADELESAGGKALAIPIDVADHDQVETAARRVEQELGPVDVWVNNAMVTVLARTWDVTPDEFRRVTEVNYLGYVHGTLAALRRMRPRDRGTIVQVGSALAFRGIPAQSPYCATKHAIEGFTESLNAELLADDSAVRLCAVPARPEHHSVRLGSQQARQTPPAGPTDLPARGRRRCDRLGRRQRPTHHLRGGIHPTDGLGEPARQTRAGPLPRENEHPGPADRRPGRS